MDSANWLMKQDTVHMSALMHYWRENQLTTEITQINSQNIDQYYGLGVVFEILKTL